MGKRATESHDATDVVTEKAVHGRKRPRRFTPKELRALRAQKARESGDESGGNAPLRPPALSVKVPGPGGASGSAVGFRPKPRRAASAVDLAALTRGMAATPDASLPKGLRRSFSNLPFSAPADAPFLPSRAPLNSSRFFEPIAKVAEGDDGGGRHSPNPPRSAGPVMSASGDDGTWEFDPERDGGSRGGALDVFQPYTVKTAWRAVGGGRSSQTPPSVTRVRRSRSHASRIALPRQADEAPVAAAAAAKPVPDATTGKAAGVVAIGGGSESSDLEEFVGNVRIGDGGGDDAELSSMPMSAPATRRSFTDVLNSAVGRSLTPSAGNSIRRRRRRREWLAGGGRPSADGDGDAAGHDTDEGGDPRDGDDDGRPGGAENPTAEMLLRGAARKEARRRAARAAAGGGGAVHRGMGVVRRREPRAAFAWDWSIKSQVRFVSGDSFEWCIGLTSADEAAGTAAAFQDNIEYKVMSREERLQAAMLYYAFPAGGVSESLSRSAALAARKDPRLRTETDLGLADWREAQEADFHAAFQSLYRLLKAGRCQYFYYKVPTLTVLFRGCDGDGQACLPHALVSSSTAGFRNILTKSAVSFERPVKGSTMLFVSNVHALYNSLLNVEWPAVPELLAVVPFVNGAMRSLSLRTRDVKRAATAVVDGDGAARDGAVLEVLETRRCLIVTGPILPSRFASLVDLLGAEQFSGLEASTKTDAGTVDLGRVAVEPAGFFDSGGINSDGRGGGGDDGDRMVARQLPDTGGYVRALNTRPDDGDAFDVERDSSS